MSGGNLSQLPSILIIEDDEAIQELVADALSEAGFDPATAKSGEESVTLLKSGLVVYRALITDINLLGRFTGFRPRRATI